MQGPKLQLTAMGKAVTAFFKVVGTFTCMYTTAESVMPKTRARELGSREGGKIKAGRCVASGDWSFNEDGEYSGARLLVPRIQ